MIEQISYKQKSLLAKLFRSSWHKPQPKKLTLCTLIAWFCLPIANIYAFQLDENFRQNLTPIIKELCHSTIDYAITDAVTDKQTQYSNLTNCLVNDSLQKSTNYWNNKGDKNASASAKKNLKFTKFERTDTANCQQKDISKIQTEQSNRGFKSVCSQQTGIAVEDFSACKLAETTLVELCGYRFFLQAKANDYQSFQEEYTSFSQKNSTIDIVPTAHAANDALEMQSQFSRQQAAYQNEIYAAQTALIETLEFVRQYQRNYHQYTWWQVIKVETDIILSRFEKMTRPMFTFSRFVNATEK